MKPWVYIRSERQLYTVGFYDPAGKWQPDSDHDNSEAAGDRVAYLNGSQEADAQGANVDRLTRELEKHRALLVRIRKAWHDPNSDGYFDGEAIEAELDELLGPREESSDDDT